MSSSNEGIGISEMLDKIMQDENEKKRKSKRDEDKPTKVFYYNHKPSTDGVISNPNNFDPNGSMSYPSYPGPMEMNNMPNAMPPVPFGTNGMLSNQMVNRPPGPPPPMHIRPGMMPPPTSNIIRPHSYQNIHPLLPGYKGSRYPADYPINMKPDYVDPNANFTNGMPNANQNPIYQNNNMKAPFPIPPEPTHPNYFNPVPYGPINHLTDDTKCTTEEPSSSKRGSNHGKERKIRSIDPSKQEINIASSLKPPPSPPKLAPQHHPHTPPPACHTPPSCRTPPSPSSPLQQPSTRHRKKSTRRRSNYPRTPPPLPPSPPPQAPPPPPSPASHRSRSKPPEPKEPPPESPLKDHPKKMRQTVKEKKRRSSKHHDCTEGDTFSEVPLTRKERDSHPSDNKPPLKRKMKGKFSHNQGWQGKGHNFPPNTPNQKFNYMGKGPFNPMSVRPPFNPMGGGPPFNSMGGGPPFNSMGGVGPPPFNNRDMGPPPFIRGDRPPFNHMGNRPPPTFNPMGKGPPAPFNPMGKGPPPFIPMGDRPPFNPMGGGMPFHPMGEPMFNPMGGGPPPPFDPMGEMPPFDHRSGGGPMFEAEDSEFEEFPYAHQREDSDYSDSDYEYTRDVKRTKETKSVKKVKRMKGSKRKHDPGSNKETKFTKNVKHTKEIKRTKEVKRVRKDVAPKSQKAKDTDYELEPGEYVSDSEAEDKSETDSETDQKGSETAERDGSDSESRSPPDYKKTRLAKLLKLAKFSESDSVSDSEGERDFSDSPKSKEPPKFPRYFKDKVAYTNDTDTPPPKLFGVVKEPPLPFVKVPKEPPPLPPGVKTDDLSEPRKGVTSPAVLESLKPTKTPLIKRLGLVGEQRLREEAYRADLEKSFKNEEETQISFKEETPSFLRNTPGSSFAFNRSIYSSEETPVRSSRTRRRRSNSEGSNDRSRSNSVSPSNSLDSEEFRLLASTKEILSASKSIFKSPTSPTFKTTRKRYEKPNIKIETVTKPDPIRHIKESPNRIDLDSRIKMMFGMKSSGEEDSPEKRNFRVSAFNHKNMRLMTRPPSPFRSRNAYHFWHRETYYFRKNNPIPDDFFDPTHKQIIGTQLQQFTEDILDKLKSSIVPLKVDEDTWMDQSTKNTNLDSNHAESAVPEASSNLPLGEPSSSKPLRTETQAVSKEEMNSLIAFELSQSLIPTEEPIKPVSDLKECMSKEEMNILINSELSNNFSSGEDTQNATILASDVDQICVTNQVTKVDVLPDSEIELVSEETIKDNSSPGNDLSAVASCLGMNSDSDITDNNVIDLVVQKIIEELKSTIRDRLTDDLIDEQLNS